jgi:O-antigen ligase
MKEGGTDPHAVSLLLAGAMCVLPFLVPYHQIPVLSFHSEWLAAALGVCAALSVLAWRGVPTVSIPSPALWLAAFSLFLVLRASGAGQAYPQIGLLAALYVLFAALMIWLGAQLASALGVERVATALAGLLLLGALANALAGAVQFYGRPALLEDVVAGLQGTRAYGNIAQSNLYADYLALGQSALLFLWLRLRVRTAYALLALLVLVAGGALSGSRGALVYALWFALLATAAERIQGGMEARRLKFAAYGVAAAVLAAHFAVPWLNAALHLGPSSEDVFSRQLAEPRWQIYSIALRVFASAPVIGVGMGGFAGAAFERGLHPSLALLAEVWTSPHNLVLHLLVETGVVGAVLALGGVGIWLCQLVRRYLAHPLPALWWILATAGVELIHSLFEFPLWSAHFLGVAALLMGVGAAPRAPSRAMSVAIRVVAAGVCGALLLSLAALLRDYVRLDAARITGTTVTLADPADARRDAATMRELGHGLMAPVAELWTVIGASMDRSDIAGKLAMSERVARFWPANSILVRRAAWLALNGEAESARALLERVVQTFPHRRQATMEILQAAAVVDAAAMRPLIVVASRVRK